ncbi:hypothetical protein IQ37_19245 [Chryseobacterium piperi]|uniref:Lipoprotein n=1 Tax=Chryseobacterium piperi TaxID=558152 RepID=A0A086A971_9FLAO|nr:hypothetical protein [Chryseobacterium piperi]ASW75271.1 hypothetical protein CJF12_13890 [Chryseobacterium piperi]KFF13235.1 hypothetical protein IQ37_19245 [Chryseobacterium piperi]
MKLKLILSGIALTALLVACTERNDEESAGQQSQNLKTEMRKSGTKATSDTLKTPESRDDTPATNETIDPTKPDRPR